MPGAKLKTVNTLAIHLVWTTYGTWLPGDPRGHWSPLFDVYGHMRERGGKLNPGDTTTHQIAAERMSEPTKRLSLIEELLVGQSIAETCRGVLHPLAVAVEPTHVHLLIKGTTVPVGEVVGRLKSNSGARLLRLPINLGRQRVWTTGYWKVFLFDEKAVATVQSYIERHNTDRGLPAKRFDWII